MAERAEYRLYEKPIDKDTLALFLLGTGRTGSTSLAQLLDLSKHITSDHELRHKTAVSKYGQCVTGSMNIEI